MTKVWTVEQLGCLGKLLDQPLEDIRLVDVLIQKHYLPPFAEGGVWFLQCLIDEVEVRH